MKILMAILAAGLIFTNAQAQDITITTDKKEYAQGEPVKITLMNGYIDDIYSHIASGTPGIFIDAVERKTPEGVREKLYPRCQSPTCIYDIDSPGMMRPGESRVFVWEPFVYNEGTEERYVADPGIYRFSSSCQVRIDQNSDDWEWEIVWSNEFVIK